MIKFNFPNRYENHLNGGWGEEHLSLEKKSEPSVLEKQFVGNNLIINNNNNNNLIRIFKIHELIRILNN